MALSRVQAAASAFGSPPSVTFSSTPTLGNGIIVFAHAYTGGATFGGVTDNKGNSYPIVVSKESGNARIYIYYCPIITVTGATFTITGSHSGHISAIEVGGLGSGNILTFDKTSSNSGSSTSPSTGTTAAITSSDCIGAAGVAFDYGLTSCTVTAGWTEDFEQLTFFGAMGESDDKLLSGVSGSTQSCSWTTSPTGGWAAAIAVFKTATVGGGGGGGATETSIVVIG